MLTWSEALTQLKSGRDVRRDSWPRLEFLRATQAKQIQRLAVSPTLQTTVAPYQLTDADQFATDWRAV